MTAGRMVGTADAPPKAGTRQNGIPRGSPPWSAPSVRILGVRIHNLGAGDAVEMLMGLAREGEKHQVVTVNPEFIMEAQTNPEFRDVLNDAELSLPDGVGILYASRLFGSPIRERVTGADTLEQICAAAAPRGLSVFLLGAAEGVADETGRILAARHPGLKVSGTYSGSPDPSDEEEILRRVNAANPHFLFVAYGSPRQELWISRNLHRLNVAIAMGVGGTFDFISGRALRAPRWMRSAGLEWLHRLYREPSRWRRMLALPRFALRCLRHRVVPIPGR